MCSQTNLPDSSAYTALEELGAGNTHSISPDGRAQRGRQAARAHLSVAQEKRKVAQAAKQTTLSRALDELVISYAQIAATHGLPMPVTYGRKCGESSPSAALGSFLESKLRARTDLSGSPEYRQVWKFSDMLLGEPIFRLRASLR